MNDNEKQFENIVRKIKFDDRPDYSHRDRLEQDIIAAMAKQPRQKEQPLNIWRTIMKTKIAKLATAAAIILGVALSISILSNSTSPAWSIEQTIEALEEFNTLNMTGVMTESGKDFDFNLWAKANEDQSQSEAFLIEAENGRVIWVQENSTYHYEPNTNTVIISSPGNKACLNPWPGSKFFQRFQQMHGGLLEITYGKDSISGRDRIFIRGSHTDDHGHKSWWVELDAKTKLPVSLKQWDNLYHEGKPNIYAKKITYYQELPNETFIFAIPEGAKIVDLSPESQFINDPNYGISADGLTQEQACRQILAKLFQAIINSDLTRVKQLFPLTNSMDDETLKNSLAKIVEVIEIRQPMELRSCKVGPVVPCIVKHSDGKEYEMRIVIKFRQINGETSCIVHSTWGSSQTID